MNIEADGDSVLVRLTSEEAGRLALAILSDFETVSRAEYYIRSGLSRAGVRTFADAIRAAAADGASSVVPLAPGVEQEEDPQRPR